MDKAERRKKFRRHDDGEKGEREPPSPERLKLFEAREKRQLSARQVSDFVSQNRANIAKFKDITNRIRLEKKRRDEANAKTKELRARRREIIGAIKAAREEIRAEIEKIRALPQGPSQEDLKAEIESLEWTLSTEDMPPKEENALAKHIRELEKQLPFARKKTETKGVISGLRKKLNETVALLEGMDKELKPAVAEANAHHEKILAYYKEAEQLGKSISYTFSQLDLARAEADADRKAFESESAAMREKEKAEREEFRRRQAEDHKTLRQKINDKARPIYEAFRAGKKISTDELLILQQSGLL
jgi:phosphoserine phosphatase